MFAGLELDRARTRRLAACIATVAVPAGWQPAQAGTELEPIVPPRAGEHSIEDPFTTQPMPVHLATTLNSRAMGIRPAQWRYASRTLRMQRATLADMGVRTELLEPELSSDEGWLDLSVLSEAQVVFDEAQQTLALTLPFSLLRWDSTVLGAGSVAWPRASASPGLLFNYDLHASAIPGGRRLSRTFSAVSELRAFRAHSVFSNTMLTRWRSDAPGHRNNSPQQRFDNVRLDTSWSHSFQDAMLTLRLGDTLTGALPWTRSTRIAGVQLARNFGLQPYRTTLALPSMMGTSALPSEIALYIEGIQHYQGRVPAGPFTITAPPGIVGRGTAQVVLTDALGRRTTLHYDLYGSSQLLAPGLSDWSVEAGWVRRRYGTASFDHASAPLLSGTWRHGVNDMLTVQAHAQMTRGLLQAGGGMVWLVHGLGVLSAAHATSQYQGRHGELHQLGYSWSNERFHISLQGTRWLRNFRDAASLYDKERTASSARALAGVQHAHLGSLNAGWLYQHVQGRQAQRYATLGWSRNLSPRIYASLNLHHDLDQPRRSLVQFSLNWSLEDGTNTGTSLSLNEGRGQLTAHVVRQAPGEGGWGWGADVQAGGSGAGQARADYRAPSYEAHAAVMRSGAATSLSMGATGALIWMDGQTFASRRVGDGFAVVSTSGVSNVPVLHEGSAAGRTSADGYLLLPQLGAYRANRISIDPVDLPAQMHAEQIEHLVAPTDRAGVHVAFALRMLRSAIIVLLGPDGQPLPMGTSVALHALNAPNSPDLPPPAHTHVGYDGAVYFESLAPQNLLRATLPDGTRCDAAVARPDSGVREIPVLRITPCGSDDVPYGD